MMTLEARSTAHEPARLVGAALAVAVLGMTLHPGLENDTWWHLALGRWMVENGAIPLHEPFASLREGDLWVRSGWLADLVLWGVHWLAGPPGLNVLASIAVAVTTFGLWLRTPGRLVMRALLVGIGALAMAAAAEARPFVLTLPLLMLVEAVLHRERSGGTRWLWSLPMISIIWANTHGTFVLVPLLVVIDLVASVVRPDPESPSRGWRLLLVLGLVSASMLVNPFGWRLLLYPLTVGQLDSLSLIEEWTPTLTVFPESLVYGSLVLLAATVAWRQREPLEAGDLVRLLLFGVLGALAVRHLPILAVVVVPVVARLAASTEDPTSGADEPWAHERAAQIAILATALIAGGLTGSAGLSRHANDLTIGQRFPVDAISAVLAATGPGDRIYHPYGWGGYVLWGVGDEVGSFVDSRTELFGDELVTLTANIERAVPGWEGALKRYDTSVILARRGSPLDVAAGHRWDLVYRDDVAVIYRRR